ncbi:MAG: MFS transporter [Armatimonadota bacterium]
MNTTHNAEPTAMTAASAVLPSPYARLRFYYGWTILMVAALAMVGTLPGRTQGLGLITESLLRDLNLSRVEYANINLWATLIGALFCIGVGRLQDKAGSRIVLTVLSLVLGMVVIAMSQTSTLWPLFALITLTRGLGQSALSVVSLAMVGQWFHRRLDKAMAIYSVVMSIGFMVAFPVVGSVVKESGWRTAWAGIGWCLILVLAPIALALVRRSPESVGLRVEGHAEKGNPDLAASADVPSSTLAQALRTPAFWVMATASALYGLVASGIGLFNESILNQRGFAEGTYYNSLVVTAMTSLVGNFLGGFLTAKGGMNRLMAVAMLLLMIGLAALPVVRTVAEVMVVAVLMGIAGGFVMVLFFSFWGRVYGRAHLGQIQGAAQMMTVLASAVGPLLLAECIDRTGSYALMFYLLALIVGLLGVAAWFVKVEATGYRDDRDSLQR